MKYEKDILSSEGIERDGRNLLSSFRSFGSLNSTSLIQVQDLSILNDNLRLILEVLLDIRYFISIPHTRKPY